MQTATESGDTTTSFDETESDLVSPINTTADTPQVDTDNETPADEVVPEVDEATTAEETTE